MKKNKTKHNDVSDGASDTIGIYSHAIGFRKFIGHTGLVQSIRQSDMVQFKVVH